MNSLKWCVLLFHSSASPIALYIIPLLLGLFLSVIVNVWVYLVDFASYLSVWPSIIRVQHLKWDFPLPLLYLFGFALVLCHRIARRKSFVIPFCRVRHFNANSIEYSMVHKSTALFRLWSGNAGSVRPHLLTIWWHICEHIICECVCICVHI